MIICLWGPCLHNELQGFYFVYLQVQELWEDLYPFSTLQFPAYLSFVSLLIAFNQDFIFNLTQTRIQVIATVIELSAVQ